MSMRRRVVSLSLSIGEEPSAPTQPTPAEQHDRQQLIAALQAAHARDHELVQTIRQLQQSLSEQNELLRTRTIERDHFKQDGHLWALCLSYLVNEEPDRQLGLPMDDVNAQEGRMLAATVDGGYVHITIEERPPASSEGGGTGG